MAGGGKRGGADRVLESRHLVGLFLGVVLLCGVFFTLGYVMGKTQYAGIVAHAAGASDKVAPSAARSDDPEAKAAPAARTAASPTQSEWDFYTKKNSDHLDASPKGAAGNDDGGGAKAQPASARYQAPQHLVKGSIVLQIAAVTHQGDALAMADELQKKKFPAFVVAPTTDNFYRVQAGPYPSEQAADAARTALDHAGFKSIIKR